MPEVDGEGEGGWQPLTSSEELVQFYDPTDLFGDLAEALADQYPDVAPEFEDDDGRRTSSRGRRGRRARRLDRRALTGRPTRRGPDAGPASIAATPSVAIRTRARLCRRRRGPPTGRRRGRRAHRITRGPARPATADLAGARAWRGASRPASSCTCWHRVRAGCCCRCIPVAGFDRVGGTVVLLVDERSPGAELLRLRDGDQVRLDGPLGRGFSVDARSRHLLVVCDGAGMARVRALLDEAVSGGRQVTLLLGVAVGGRGAPLLAPAGRGRVRGRHRGRLAGSPRRRRRPRPRLRGLGRPVLRRRLLVAARAAGDAGPRARRVAWAWHASGVGPGAAATRDGCASDVAGCRWPCPTRPAAPWGSAWAASSRAPMARCASAERGRPSRSASWPGAAAVRPGPVGRRRPVTVDLAPLRPGGLRLAHPVIVAAGGAGYATELLDAVGELAPAAIVTRSTTRTRRRGQPAAADGRAAGRAALVDRAARTPASMPSCAGTVRAGAPRTCPSSSASAPTARRTSAGWPGAWTSRRRWPGWS